MSTIEDKAMALNNYRVLHVKLPVELFDLLMNFHRQDVDLFTALNLIRQLENEGVLKEAPTV